MRPLHLGLAAAVAALAITPDPSAAQQQRGDASSGRAEQEDRARRERQRREWGGAIARLPGQTNAGPCPFVKVLYDAGRYVEFGEPREVASAVAWSGEIQGVEAECRYRATDPITIDMAVNFAFGKGPKAEGDSKTYRWWVAVTERNRTVLAKEYFATTADFRGGERTTAVERLGGITIPRAGEGVSGSNFEVLVGFDVTPAMAEFNRDGKRFRVDSTAGQTASR